VVLCVKVKKFCPNFVMWLVSFSHLSSHMYVQYFSVLSMTTLEPNPPYLSAGEHAPSKSTIIIGPVVHVRLSFEKSFHVIWGLGRYLGFHTGLLDMALTKMATNSICTSPEASRTTQTPYSYTLLRSFDRDRNRNLGL